MANRQQPEKVFKRFRILFPSPIAVIDACIAKVETLFERATRGMATVITTFHWSLMCIILNQEKEERVEYWMFGWLEFSSSFASRIGKIEN